MAPRPSERPIAAGDPHVDAQSAGLAITPALKKNVMSLEKTWVDRFVETSFTRIG